MPPAHPPRGKGVTNGDISDDVSTWQSHQQVRREIRREVKALGLQPSPDPHDEGAAVECPANIIVADADLPLAQLRT
jgi:hypothetical protein